MTKLEEIALAIHRARYPDAAVMDGIEGLSPAAAADVLEEARAAVDAMLEPTESILDALSDEDGADPKRLWQQAIDAILNEKPGA